MSYTDIMSNQSPNGLSMGTPTIDQGALVANVGQLNAQPMGIASPTATGAAAPAMAPIGTQPGAAGAGGAKGPGFFGQGGFASMALGAIQTLGSLWNSFQQTKLAKQNLAFQKEAYYTNLENQEKSYNTALEDRINARYVTEGKSQAEADSYIAKNRL